MSRHSPRGGRQARAGRFKGSVAFPTFWNPHHGSRTSMRAVCRVTRMGRSHQTKRRSTVLRSTATDIIYRGVDLDPREPFGALANPSGRPAR